MTKEIIFHTGKSLALGPKIYLGCFPCKSLNVSKMNETYKEITILCFSLSSFRYKRVWGCQWKLRSYLYQHERKVILSKIEVVLDIEHNTHTILQHSNVSVSDSYDSRVTLHLPAKSSCISSKMFINFKKVWINTMRTQGYDHIRIMHVFLMLLATNVNATMDTDYWMTEGRVLVCQLLTVGMLPRAVTRV